MDTHSAARRYGIFCVLFIALATVTVAAEPITRIADVRALSREVAAEGLPVRVRGVVEWLRGGKGPDFTLADESAGIYALPSAESKAEAEAWKLHANLEIEVEGVTSAGGYAPVIVAQRVSVLGPGKAWPLRKVSIAHLSGGHEDGQRIELEKVVVQSVIEDGEDEMRALRVCSGSGDYTLLWMKKEPWNEPEKVIDAEVVARGTVLTLYNSRLEQTGVRIAVSAMDDFTLMKSPPDPFSVPRVEIGALRLFRPEGVSRHRRSVEGSVTWVSATELVIESEERGVSVRATTAKGIRVGDRVLVSGFIEARQPIAFFTNAAVKKIADGEAPPAVTPSVEEILRASHDNSGRSWGLPPKDFNYRLVRIKGTLMAHLAAGTEAFSIQAESGEQVAVRFASGAGGFSQAPLAGSVVEVTGVATVLHGPGDPLPEFRRPVGVELLLREAGDLQVLSAPSWWTLRRLQLALAGVAALLSLVMAWVLLLRRTVKRQALRIENALRTHRDAELEHEAAKRERIRLAGDLHDGVHQLLNAASYRLESVARLSESDPVAALPHVAAAKKILDRSQHEMRSIMWGIHELAKGEPDFSELLTHALAGMDHWPADVVKVSREGSPQAVPARAAGSLLLLTQEAVQNALNHGQATEIQVQVKFADEALHLTIEDNGHGFDSATVQPTAQGGLGLGSMKRRVDELGGTLQLTSAPRQGTRLHIELPWDALASLFPKTPSPNTAP
ncbi:MAG: sensor histidine kinase [Verrucomicrobiaceae bacterium]|nr:sensor histidine kinase [Verrucomicrobiaceae bacterium]